MGQLGIILLASWLAGLAAFVGGVIARFDYSRETELKAEIIHGVIAFGGGILAAAVAFALAPEGIEYLEPMVLLIVFCAGGTLFCAIDSYLTRRGGNRAQFLAMLMDFIPEAISLGAVFKHNQQLGILLAVYIGAQNLPEGFNSFREIKKTGIKSGTTLTTLFAISFLGPMSAGAGYFFLQSFPELTAGIMTFAAGGILYLIFQDISPKSKMQKHWVPPLGAVLGFAVGMIGKQLIG